MMEYKQHCCVQSPSLTWVDSRRRHTVLPLSLPAFLSNQTAQESCFLPIIICNKITLTFVHVFTFHFSFSQTFYKGLCPWTVDPGSAWLAPENSCIRLWSRQLHRSRQRRRGTPYFFGIALLSEEFLWSLLRSILMMMMMMSLQGMFALGRLVSVLLATKFSPAFMLLCNIVRSVVIRFRWCLQIEKIRYQPNNDLHIKHRWTYCTVLVI